MRNMAPTVLLALTGLLAPAHHPLSASPPNPSYGGAIVDGHFEDWDLAQDLFANMHRAGDPAKKLECRAYLRFDCNLQIMYVLVLAEPDVVAWCNATTSSAMSWVAIESNNRKVVNEYSGNDGHPPDFSWVDPGYDSDPSHVRGFEASFRLSTGDGIIFIHQMTYDAGLQTAATIGSPKKGLPFTVACMPMATRQTTWSQIKSLYR
jgi:hypothetical protein